MEEEIGGGKPTRKRDDERQKRLEAALRANLRRRKEQARARADRSSDAADRREGGDDRTDRDPRRC